MATQDVSQHSVELPPTQSIPNKHFNIAEIEWKVVNDKQLCNFTKLSKELEGDCPSYYTRSYKQFGDKLFGETIDQSKYVCPLWIVIFLLHNSTPCRDDFLMWIASQLEKEIFQNGRLTQSMDTSMRDEGDENEQRVDLSPLGICCESCNSTTFLKKKSTNKKKIWDLSDTTYRNRKVDTIMTIIIALLSCVGYDLIQVLALYFQRKMDDLKTMLSLVILNPKDDEVVNSRVVKIKQQVNNNFDIELRTSKEEIQYWKDFQLMSDERYQSMVDWIGFNYLLPCSKTLCRFRKEIHELINVKYCVSYGKSVVTCDFVEVFKSLLQIHKNECIRLNINPRLLIVDVKLAIDKGANSFLVAALGALNLILSPQSRLSYISCALLDENETKATSEEVFKYVVDVLEAHKGSDGLVRINGVILNIFVVNDLKMVGLLTDLYDDDCFCPFCRCTKERRNEFEIDFPSRVLKYVGSVLFVITTLICSLHMKMRVVSNLIKQIMLRINSIHTFKIIEERMRKLPHCSQFAFRTTKDEKLGSQEDEQEVDQTKLHLPYLNGDQVDEILENFEMVFEGVMDYQEKLIWEVTRVIFFNFVDGDVGKKGDQGSFVVLTLLCKCLGELLQTRYLTSKFAYYLHILIKHLPILTFNYGPISKYANEGTENIHAGHILGLERSTSAGGRSLDPKSPMEQLLQQEHRRIYLASEMNFPWMGKLNTDNEQDDPKKECRRQKEFGRLVSVYQRLEKWIKVDHPRGWIYVMIDEYKRSETATQVASHQVPNIQTSGVSSL